MKTKFNYFFASFLILFLAASIVGAGEGQEKTTALHQARINFEKNGKAPTEINFAGAQQPSVAAFFDEYKLYFQITDDNQIKAYSSSQNELGAHHRYIQHYKGIPIIGAEYILHEKNGKVWYANGQLVHDLKMDVAPALGESAALQAALNHLGADAYMWQSEASESFLKKERGDASATFYPKGELKLTSGQAEMISENFKLVYRFDIYAAKPFGRYYIDVDAKTGEIVNQISRIHDVDFAGSGASLYNGTVSMTVDQVSGSSYRLQENGNTVRAADIRTYNMNNGTSYNNTDFTSTSANGPWDGAGVSAHWGAEATYDYYFLKHNRNSLNNAGFTLLSYVHANLVGMGYPNNVNAFWDGSRMTYGDGDGVNYFPLVCLDVVGHELTHGVTEFESNLIYQNQSGALNESFSDIFGNAVELYKESSSLNSGFPVAKWRVGEDLTANGLGIRHMASPNDFSDPDTYQGTFWYSGTADNGGVHTNSGVQNFWFYLLVEGGSGTNDAGTAYNVTGIGLTDAASIAYTNNTSFLTSSSNYAAARTGAIAAAEGLFGVGSQQALSTAAAWAAVGVGTTGGGGGTVITSDNFESGMGSYTDGGADMSRYTGGTHAHQGVAAADIQDNAGTASSFSHTATYNVTAYNTLEVDFWFKMVSMETNENFWVQYFDGTTWQTVANIVRNSSVLNNVFYHQVVTIPRSTYTFPTNARLRFMCDASDNNDDVYIDEIVFRGLTTGSLAEGGNSFVASEALPTSFELKQNYPNPFNPTTTIDFSLPDAGKATLRIYSITGQLVRELSNANYTSGQHQITWDAKDERGLQVATGVYFYKLEVKFAGGENQFVQTKKMTLMK